MRTLKIITGFCLSVFMLATIACSGLTKSDKPAISRWWLEPYVTETHALSVDQPGKLAVLITVVPGLDTDRILTLSENAELGQFASARWVGHVPELVASLLERSLQATGRFEIVSESAASRPGNCLLELELRKFFADIGPGERTTGVSVSAHGAYQCGSATVIDIRSDVSIPVADERMTVIVAAFQRAMNQVTRDVINEID
jgi:ABC-type uncharacterized transport system auxiliary subunit